MGEDSVGGEEDEADEAGFMTSESDAGSDEGAVGEEPVSPRPQDDPASDSSEDERPGRNTVGNVPLEWYDAEEHIGYDKDGNKLVKKGRKDKLDTLLARNDSTKVSTAKAWRGGGGSV